MTVEIISAMTTPLTNFNWTSTFWEMRQNVGSLALFLIFSKIRLSEQLFSFEKMWNLGCFREIYFCFTLFFRTLGFCRRRVGRGGRILTDRAFHQSHQSIVKNLNLSNYDSELIPILPETNNTQLTQQVNKKFLKFDI